MKDRKHEKWQLVLFLYGVSQLFQINDFSSRNISKKKIIFRHSYITIYSILTRKKMMMGTIMFFKQKIHRSIMSLYEITYWKQSFILMGYTFYFLLYKKKKVLVSCKFSFSGFRWIYTFWDVLNTIWLFLENVCLCVSVYVW